MKSINRPIGLASDVGRYHVIRANILDQAGNSATTTSNRAGLALGAYQANGRAVATNPFDFYGRLHLAESTLKLATLGHLGKEQQSIEEFLRLTTMVPGYWLPYLLLGRA